jgi:hypothetical protein
LRDDSSPLLALKQGLGFLQIDASRLFDQDVSSGGHGGKRGRGVAYMRIGDEDRVDAAIYR